MEFWKRTNTNISDDGKGFDISVINIKNHDINSGFGLLSMREKGGIIRRKI